MTFKSFEFEIDDDYPRLIFITSGIYGDIGWLWPDEQGLYHMGFSRPELLVGVDDI